KLRFHFTKQQCCGRGFCCLTGCSHDITYVFFSIYRHATYEHSLICFSVTPPFWMPSESWSSCSEECGEGIEKRRFLCVQNDHYNATILLDESQCTHLPDPVMQNIEVHQRTCKLGPCGKGYRWKVSNWGHCSQTCGGLGVMSRDVQCIYSGKDGDLVMSDFDAAYYCGNYRQPERHAPCNRFACKPEFVPEKWGKVSWTILIVIVFEHKYNQDNLI
ncbi:unnamed protein product, partial [Trichobilharzia regenti]